MVEDFFIVRIYLKVTCNVTFPDCYLTLEKLELNSLELDLFHSISVLVPDLPELANFCDIPVNLNTPCHVIGGQWFVKSQIFRLGLSKASLSVCFWFSLPLFSHILAILEDFQRLG